MLIFNLEYIASKAALHCFLVFFYFEEANFGAIKMWNTWIFVGWIFRVKTEFFVYNSSFVGIEWMFRVLHKKPP